VALPPVGAGGWIELEQGDPDFPIWSGGWWARQGNCQLPRCSRASIRSRSSRQANRRSHFGHVGPTGGVSLCTTSGALITVSEAGIVIEIGQGASITLTGNKVHITGVMV
jgi:hypothetical protein